MYEFNEFQMQQYVGEVLHQVEAAALAIVDLKGAVLDESDPSLSIPRAFAAVQGLLGAAAILSNLLWPNPASKTVDCEPLSADREQARQRTLARGKALRKTLGVTGASPLQNRKVRNGFEHIDERLDQYLFEHARGASRYFVDRSIMAPDKVRFGGQPAVFLRLIDPGPPTVSVMGDTLELLPLNNAIDDLGYRAQHWLQDHGPMASHL